MKIDKNYFKSETKISRANRVASVLVYGRGSTLKHYILGRVFLFIFRFNPIFSALNLIFSVLSTFVLLPFQMVVSLQHKQIKKYQNEKS